MRYIFVLFSLFFITTQSLAGSLPDAPHIITTGSYEFSATPDTLHMSMQVFEIGQDAAKARDIVEKQSLQLISTMKQFGIKAADITSANLNVSPRFNWNNNQQIYTGTEVSRRIEVTLRDLSKYDALLQAVLATKIIRINNSQLSSSKADELEAKGLQKAIANAKKRAELLVQGLPQKIGNVYSISTTNQGPTPMTGRYQASNMEMTKSAFEPGRLKINTSVHVVFYLINK